jgi:hypothetical protein
MVKVGACEVLYHIDYVGRAVHLLDKNNGGRTLTNSIDPSWQKQFIYQEMLLTDILDFDWYCYATDGIVATYCNYNFNFIKDYSKLHAPYLDVMRQRGEYYK